MTKEKSKNQVLFLDIVQCENIYRAYKVALKSYPELPQLSDFETRYKHRLESVLFAVQTRAVYGDLSVIEIAAAYFARLAKTQCFLDGNKRSAVIFTNTFLRANGFSLRITPHDMTLLALFVAQDREESIEITEKALSMYFNKHITGIPKSKI